jgi:hypothetical protein
VNSEPLISVIICTFERYNLLDGAIESLKFQTLGKDAIEIIVIDNSLDQARAQIASQTYAQLPNLRYIISDEAGLSRARNLGLAHARAEIAAFIDDDAVAEPGWAAALLEGFASFGPGTGAVGGPVAPIWPRARPDWLGNDLLIFLGLIDWGREPHKVLARRGLIGCNMAMDRKLALSLGGFPVALGRHGPDVTLLSNEETALLEKIEMSGRIIAYVPAASVRHVIDARRLVQDWFIRRAAWQAISDYMMQPHAHNETTAPAARFEATACPADIADAAVFSGRFWVTYHAVLTALAGGAMPVGPSASFARQMRLSAIKNKIFSQTQTVPIFGPLARLALRAVRGKIREA